MLNKKITIFINTFMFNNRMQRVNNLNESMIYGKTNSLTSPNTETGIEFGEPSTELTSALYFAVENENSLIEVDQFTPTFLVVNQTLNQFFYLLKESLA